MINLPPFINASDPNPAAPASVKPVESRVATKPAAPASEAVVSPPEKPAAVPATPPLSAEERKARLELLTAILTTAANQAFKYNQTFRDLSAEETRLSERIDRQGEVKQQRRVVCDLVVYQSRLDPEMAYEYRSAKTVDGKPVKQDEKHIEKFFQKLLKAKSTRVELDLMNEESFQHDLELGGAFYGLTLSQWREVMKWALPDVGFEILGREIIEGKQTVAIFYRQLRPNKQLEWRLPKGIGFEKAQQFSRGRLWLDVETMQIRRAERELTLLFPGEKQVVTVWRQTMSYKQSLHGIYVPDKFLIEYLYHIERGKDGLLTSALSGRMTSVFGEFKRFDVTSEEQEKKTILKDEEKPPTPPTKQK